MADIRASGYFDGVEVEKLSERLKKIKLSFDNCDEYGIIDEIILTLSPREFGSFRACVKEALKKGLSSYDTEFEANIVIAKHQFFHDEISENQVIGKAHRKKGLYGGYY